MALLRVRLWTDRAGITKPHKCRRVPNLVLKDALLVARRSPDCAFELVAVLQATAERIPDESCRGIPAMKEVLQPWRRKIALCVLILAVVAAFMWVKSAHYIDTFIVKIGPQSAIAVQSRKRGILAMYVVDDENRLFVNNRFHSSSEVDVLLFEPNQYDWRWHWRGFDLGRGTQTYNEDVAYLTKTGATSFKLYRGVRTMKFVGIPQWAFSPALAAITAWLLLSKGRLTKKETAEQTKA